MNLQYSHEQSTVVMSGMVGMVLLVATWNCWRSNENGYAGLLVLHLLSPLNPWLIVEIGITLL